MYLNWIGYFYLRKERNQERKKEKSGTEKMYKEGKQIWGKLKIVWVSEGGNKVNGKNDQSFVVSFNFNSTQEKNNY